MMTRGARFTQGLMQRPYVLLSLTALFWSGNMVLARALGVSAAHGASSVGPYTLAFARWTIVLLCMLPLAWPHWRKASVQQSAALRQAWLPLLALSFTGITVYNTVAYVAVHSTTANNVSLLNSFVPIVTMLLGWIFLRRRISRLQGVGVFCSTLGVFAILSQWSWQRILGLQFNHGDLIMLIAVFDWAVYTVLLQWRPKVHHFVFLAASTGLGLVLLLPFFVWELAQIGWPAWTAGNLTSIPSSTPSAVSL